MPKEDNLLKLELWEGVKTILESLPNFQIKDQHIYLDNKKLICDIFVDFNGFEIKLSSF